MTSSFRVDQRYIRNPKKKGSLKKELDYQDAPLIKVYFENGTFTLIKIDNESTAQNVLETVCKRKMLSSPRYYLRSFNNKVEFSGDISVVTSKDELELVEKSIIKFKLEKSDGIYGFYLIGEDLLSRERGVYVFSVEPSSPAAGILFPGDQLLSVNGDVLSIMTFPEACKKFECDEIEVVAAVKRKVEQTSSVERVDFDFEAAAEHRTLFLTARDVENISCNPIPEDLLESLNSVKIPSELITFVCETFSKIIDVNEISLEGQDLPDILGKTKKLAHECTSLILPPGQSGPGKMTKQDFRVRVLLEILNTERSYCQDLVTLHNHYIKPLNNLELLAADEGADIEKNVKDLIELHTNFLSDLEPVIDMEIDPPMSTSPVDKRAGSTALCFLAHVYKFRTYSEYCRNYAKALEIIESLQTDNRFLSFVKEKNPENEQSKSLESFLIKPVQRILKYPLLLKELQKYSGDGAGGDPEEVEEALNCTKEVAAEINEIQREYERKQEELNIINSLDWGEFEDVKGTCENLLFSAEVTIIDKTGKHWEPYDAYLFKQKLILCKKRKKEASKVTECFSVGQIIARDVASQEGKYYWSLVDGTTTKSFTLESKKADQKTKWLNLIREQTKNAILK